MTLLISAVVWVAVTQPGGGPPPAAVRVDAVRQESVEDWRVVAGEFFAVRRANVASEQPGLVIEFSLEEGDRVEQGQVLARLHDARIRLEVARTRAEVASRGAILEERRARLDLAEQERRRFEEAATRSSVGEMELDQRRTTALAEQARVQQAEADLESAQAEHDLALERLNEMTIRAPFAGVVVAKRTELGQWIAVGDAVVELADTSLIDVRLDVPDALVGRVAERGARARVRLKGTGEVLEAPVLTIVPVADPVSRLTPVRLRVENPEGRLRPGMSVLGLVPAGVKTEALTLHKDALRRDDAGEFVFFDRGGMAAVARVESVFAVGDRVVVRSPMLAPGTRVVVEGNERLYPTAALNVIGDTTPQGLRGEGN